MTTGREPGSATPDGRSKLRPEYLAWRARFISEKLPVMVQYEGGLEELQDLHDLVGRVLGALRPVNVRTRVRMKKCSCPTCRVRKEERAHGPYTVAEFWDPSYKGKGAWRVIPKDKRSRSVKEQVAAAQLRATLDAPEEEREDLQSPRPASKDVARSLLGALLD